MTPPPPLFVHVYGTDIRTDPPVPLYSQLRMNVALTLPSLGMLPHLSVLYELFVLHMLQRLRTV
jgi:hypothetical protein